MEYSNISITLNLYLHPRLRAEKARYLAIYIQINVRSFEQGVVFRYNHEFECINMNITERKNE